MTPVLFVLIYTGAAVISFLLGRFALRGWISRKFVERPHFKAIDDAPGSIPEVSAV